MAAGDAKYIVQAKPLLVPMCSTIIECGAVPNGLLMKLAVNLVSGAIMTALAEGANYAKSQGLDVELFGSILNASSLPSNFFRMKIPKLAKHDFSVQGALNLGRKDFDMMKATSEATGAATPLLNVCRELWDEAITLGFGCCCVSAVLPMAKLSRSSGSRMSRGIRVLDVG